MPRPKQSVIDAELERLRKLNKGRLRAVDVVKAATPKTSPLHHCFTWDDSKAAHQWRIEQARDLIQCSCITLPNSDGQQVRVSRYMSFKGDRANNTGYRAMEDIMANSKLTAMMLKEALSDLSIWEARYKRLEALAPIRKAASEVRKKAA
jgi:hypothetical protein